MTDCDITTHQTKPTTINHTRRWAVGDVVTLIRTIAVPMPGQPFVVPAGSLATILDVDPETGDLVLCLDRYFPALYERRNVICMTAAKAQIDLA